MAVGVLRRMEVDISLGIGVGVDGVRFVADIMLRLSLLASRVTASAKHGAKRGDELPHLHICAWYITSQGILYPSFG